MTRSLFFWLCCLGITVLLLWLLSSILLPFVAGMAVAYFLDPACDRLERLGLSRSLATWVVTILFTLAFIIRLALILPAAISLPAALLLRLRQPLESLRGTRGALLRRLDSQAAASLLTQARSALSGSLGNFMSIMTDAARGLLSGGAAIV